MSLTFQCSCGFGRGEGIFEALPEVLGTKTLCHTCNGESFVFVKWLANPEDDHGQENDDELGDEGLGGEDASDVGGEDVDEFGDEGLGGEDASDVGGEDVDEFGDEGLGGEDASDVGGEDVDKLGDEGLGGEDASDVGGEDGDDEVGGEDAANDLAHDGFAGEDKDVVAEEDEAGNNFNMLLDAANQIDANPVDAPFKSMQTLLLPPIKSMQTLLLFPFNAAVGRPKKMKC
ncbi:hypothetical protein V6N13_066477 [Hibiscus sabdariffa]|uniref:Uncharacterized protein n=1 Tax=Hibiscus sabdariffa TaxID=183260 RepID=A0ABR2DQJ6_9ROSI